MVRQNYKTVSTSTLSLINKIEKSTAHKESDLVHQIISRSSTIRNEVVVTKITSHIINNEELLSKFLKNIALLHKTGARVLIVHDIDTETLEHALKFFGVDESKFKDIQMSDHKSASIVEMVMSGYINKKLVGMLCEIGCNAIGISGKDCDIIRAEQRVRKTQNKNIVSIGFASDPSMINAEAVLMLMESDMLVVFSPIASCNNGTTCVIDSNVTSALLATALTAKYLILSCANPNIDDGKMIITDYDRHHLKQMRADPRSSNDFKLILDTATSALDNYVDYICIIDETMPESVLQAIFCMENKLGD